MKRHINKVLTAASVVLAAAVACTDERNNFMVEDSILFRDEGYMGVSVLDREQKFAVLKSGKGQSEATVRLYVSEVALAEYNAENGTDYALLPEQYYDLSATTLHFSEKDVRQIVELSWDDAAVLALGDDKSYVVPLQLAVANNTLAITDERKALLLNPRWSYVSMARSQTSAISPSIFGTTKSYEASVVMDFPVNSKEISVTFALDNSLVADYNKANGTSYAVPPDGFVSLPSEPAVFAAGETVADFSYDIISSIFFTTGEFDGFDDNGYIIPIRISSVSSDGIGIRDDVMYVPVTMEEKEIIGPWKLLEGEENCYGKQPGGGTPTWLPADGYSPARLFDGDLSTEWISWWFDPGESALEQNIVFPMEFVADMGSSHVFTEFYISDYVPYYGNYRKYEIYLAETYDANDPSKSEWKLAASGLCDYIGQATTYTFPPADGFFELVEGRYIKFVIVEPQHDYDTCWWGRGKLSEVWGYGY